MTTSAPARASERNGGAGWAIMLADLALILFIVTASHAGTSEAAPAAPDPVPQAIYRPAADAPPLAEWISAQDPGKKASLQITLGYDPHHPEQALARAAEFAAQAAQSGIRPRIVLSPGTEDVSAVLAYDR